MEVKFKFFVTLTTAKFQFFQLMREMRYIILFALCSDFVSPISSDCCYRVRMMMTSTGQ